MPSRLETLQRIKRIGDGLQMLGREMHPSYRKNLRSHRPRFSGVFSRATWQAWARANSTVSSSSVRSEEVCSCHGQSVCVRVATPEFLQHLFA